MSDEGRNEVAVADEDDENFLSDDELLRDEGEDDLDLDQFEDTEVMSGGASIATPGGSIYWLKLEHLAEFNRMDKVITDDQDFWAWFDGAVNTWGLRSTGQQHKKRGSITNLWDKSSSGGWSSGSWNGWSSAPKKYLSDYWHGTSWFGGKTAARDRKLAIAVQAVQTTIRVVDNHARRMRVVVAVDENEGQPESYTSYDEQLIQVSPMALLDEKIEEGDGIDVTTGFGLHEAGHAEYGEATLKALRQPFLIRPVAVASLMHNVLEDVRTEGLTACDEDSVFPGFKGYLDRARKYMWDLSDGKQPTKWGPEVKDMVNAIILAGKWYDEYRPMITDAALATEVDWYHDLVEQYHRKDIALRPALVAMMDRLKSDPEAKKRLDTMEGEEKAMEKLLGDAERDERALKELVKQALKKFGMDGLSSCSSGSMPGGGVHDPSGKRKSGIGASEAEQINRLVRSEIESATVEEMHLPDLDGANPKITVLHPPETTDSRAEYKPADSSLVAKMRSVFFFRPTAMEDVDRLMRTGQVDEDELWRAGVQDYRLFEQKRVESTPDTSVTMLIDASGSMTGYIGRYSPDGKTKVGVAQDLAQVMQAVLKDMNGVKTRVRAHTGDCADAGGTGAIAIYKIWEHGEPLSRLALMSTDIDHSDNYDGYAIGWCIKELIDQGTPNEQKVLIVLSDGYPAGQGYQGEPAFRHMRETIAWGEKNGVTTIQIAIQGGMNQADMFKNFVTFETVEKLPQQLTSLLRKVFPYR